ncbi:uncharacterized protein LOC128241221 [Mya arenaria]|uniref:uncharacterized protein LOC128241221 n=1 Tax=Mya arenaria TaxID=6604 RepID=UPI0022DEE561|nr:uncharacterized protein LOC128241221 [Mya arenaria]
MDLRTFAAFLIMAVCFIKQSDGQITAWAETGGNSATITGASGTMTVAALSESVAANGALFTVTATPTGTDTIASYAFTTGGNPGTAGTIATATSGAVTATNAISDSIATSYVFEIM